MDSSLYCNGRLCFLYCAKLILRIDAGNASFLLSIFFIVLLLADTVIDCFVYSLLCASGSAAGHGKKKVLTTT